MAWGLWRFGATRFSLLLPSATAFCESRSWLVILTDNASGIGEIFAQQSNRPMALALLVSINNRIDSGAGGVAMRGIVSRQGAVFGSMKAMVKYWKGRRVSQDVTS